MNALIIEDDRKLIDLVTTYLAQFQIRLTAAERPSVGLQLLQKDKFDIVLLDVMLPEMDGFQTLQEIRKNSQVPVIMLTARGELSDRVVGLEMGADDYLPKPFEPRELAARMQALVRRARPQETVSETLQALNLTLDLKRREGFLDNEALNLTTHEFEILHLFMSRAGQALNRDQIMEALRGIDWDAFNRSIDISISRVRQKLKDEPKHPRFIKTIWGTGYMFIAPLAKAAP